MWSNGAICIIIAVCSSISFTQFLIVEDGLLERLGVWIDTLSGKWNKLLTCSVCLSGQISLWLYPIISFDSYSILFHVMAVTSSMVAASILLNRYFI